MFLVGNEWKPFTKTAVFWQSSDTRYEVLLDDADSCNIPWEAQTDDGFMFVGLIGRKDDTVVASKVLILPVNEGVQAGTDEPALTQPLYDQLIARAADYAESAKRSAEAIGKYVTLEYLEEFVTSKISSALGQLSIKSAVFGGEAA